MADDTLEAAFPRLNAKQMRCVAEFAEPVEFADGEILFDVGQPNVPLYVVEAGEIEIFECSTGTRRLVTSHAPGAFTGDVDMLTGRPVVVSAVAKGRCRVYRVPSERIRRLLNEIPDLSDMLLDAFQTRRRLLERSGFLGVRVVGAARSKETMRLREFFYRNHVPHTFFDVAEPSGQEQLRELGIAEDETPALACRKAIVKQPSLAKVAECLGISRDVDDKLYDLLIIGAGPSGLAAAVYGASEGLSTLVVDSVGPGGQAGSSSKIENFIGFPAGISGADLANRGYLQALKFGAQFSAPTSVRAIERNGDPELHARLCSGQTAKAKCILVASGVSYRQLDIEGMRELEGAGVYYAATTVEARVCRNSTAVVVGGGNSAGQAAMFLAQTAKRVLLVIRGEDLGKSMSSYLCARIEHHPPDRSGEAFGSRRRRRRRFGAGNPHQKPADGRDHPYRMRRDFRLHRSATQHRLAARFGASRRQRLRADGLGDSRRRTLDARSPPPATSKRRSRASWLPATCAPAPPNAAASPSATARWPSPAYIDI